MNSIRCDECTKCAHMTVCQYKAEYIDYLNRLRNMENIPSYVKLVVDCNHHMDPVSTQKYNPFD